MPESSIAKSIENRLVDDQDHAPGFAWCNVDAIFWAIVLHFKIPDTGISSYWLAGRIGIGFYYQCAIEHLCGDCCNWHIGFRYARNNHSCYHVPHLTQHDIRNCCAKENRVICVADGFAPAYYELCGSRNI